MKLSKALFVALFAIAATPALANEPVKLPSKPIMAEAPVVAPVIAPTTEVLPSGEVKKEEGKIEEKKEELKHELPATGAEGGIAK